jgi:hypothetical protein
MGALHPEEPIREAVAPAATAQVWVIGNTLESQETQTNLAVGGDRMGGAQFDPV